MGKGKKNKNYFHNVAAGYFFNCLYYKTTKNPLFLWEIYRLCRKEEIAIPKWVYKYFDECADKILINNDPGDKAPSLCHEALGLKSKGPGTPWKKVSDEIKKWEAYVLFQKEDEALPEASRRDILEKTIEKLLKDFGPDSDLDTRTLNRWIKSIKEKFQNKDEIRAIFDEMRESFGKD